MTIMSEAAGFAAGFVPRADAASIARLALIAPDDFAPSDIKARAHRGRGGPRATAAPEPKSFSPQPVAPRSHAPDDEEIEETLETHDGFVDPIAAARAAGFSEGVAHARTLADADDDHRAALAAALADTGRIDREALARRLRETVMFLVTQLVGEIGVSADLLAARVAAATDLLADGAEAAVLRLHPDDAALIAAALPDHLHAIGDASLARGSFVIEAASTIVEDGPERWLEQLGAAIERVALPPLC